ncbi:MAG: hypothetical protein K2Y26_14135 [Gemmatimonadaceae bacterium]|nr:hypothetical protein [Gemmatimonadaceae bacterium]
MTQVQFAALAHRCSKLDAPRDVVAATRFRDLRSGALLNRSAVSKWLRNGWNTEHLLRQNASLLEGDALRSSLQWAFAQAYYSAYTITCALFNAAGFPEQSHASVIQRQARLAIAGYYPKALAFALDGAKPPEFHGLLECALPSPLHFDFSNDAVADMHIRGFLKGTRSTDLKERRQSMQKSFRTKRGTPKKQLSANEWAEVSKRHGPTGLLSLLYRKRIKANYREIDTFISEHLDARALYEDLIQVVAAINSAHELMIAKVVGQQELADFAARLAVRGLEFLGMRSAGWRALEA